MMINFINLKFMLTNLSHTNKTIQISMINLNKPSPFKSKAVIDHLNKNSINIKDKKTQNFLILFLILNQDPKNLNHKQEKNIRNKNPVKVHQVLLLIQVVHLHLHQIIVQALLQADQVHRLNLEVYQASHVSKTNSIKIFIKRKTNIQNNHSINQITIVIKKIDQLHTIQHIKNLLTIQIKMNYIQKICK